MKQNFVIFHIWMNSKEKWSIYLWRTLFGNKYSIFFKRPKLKYKNSYTDCVQIKYSFSRIHYTLFTCFYSDQYWSSLFYISLWYIHPEHLWKHWGLLVHWPCKALQQEANIKISIGLTINIKTFYFRLNSYIYSWYLQRKWDFLFINHIRSYNTKEKK